MRGKSGEGKTNDVIAGAAACSGAMALIPKTEVAGAFVSECCIGGERLEASSAVAK